MKFSYDIVSLLQETLKKEGWIELPSQGTSMYPLIKSGDICRFKPWKEAELKKGDILLFWQDNGKLIAHRFHHKHDFEGIQYLVCKGDSNLSYDQPVAVNQVLGKLEYIQKTNKKVNIQNAAPRIWKNLMLNMPILSGYLRSYLNKRSVGV